MWAAAMARWVSQPPCPVLGQAFQIQATLASLPLVLTLAPHCTRVTQVVFHAALSGLFKRAHGVEYVPRRHALATQVHRSLATAAKSPKLSARLGGSQACVQVAGAMRRVSLACGDATAGPLHFSHVYMYDKVFNTATSQALAQQLNASRFRVLVTFRSASSWAALGLMHCVQVGTLVMRTTGGQSFRCYVLANTREW